jgi:drug/metabolite transporter (DMT)-like permease
LFSNATCFFMLNSIHSYLDTRPTIKGYLFAFLATLGMANVYVFSKAALSELSIIQFGFFWFAMGLLYSLIYLLWSGKIKLIRELNRKSKRLLIIIGLLETLAATTMFLSIRIVENPAVVSFLSNLTPIFVTLLGISFLKEKFNYIEAIGIIFTITGAILISYTGQSSLKDIFIEGTGYILMSSFFLSISLILAKYRIKKLDPGILMINRISYMFFLSLALMIYTGQSFSVSGTAFFNVGIGSFLGPFLTAIAQYSALKYIEASRTMIVQSTRGFFVAIGAIIYLGILPTAMQIFGGSVTIIGVVIVMVGKRLKKKKRKD